MKDILPNKDFLKRFVSRMGLSLSMCLFVCSMLFVGCGSSPFEEVTNEEEVQHAIRITQILFGSEYTGRVLTADESQIQEICGEGVTRCFRDNPPGNKYMLIPSSEEAINPGMLLCEGTMLGLMENLFPEAGPTNVFGRSIDPSFVAQGWCKQWEI